jgi:hypothetical protein
LTPAFTAASIIISWFASAAVAIVDTTASCPLRPSTTEASDV